MKALIIGATGATGKDLLTQVLDDDNFSQVIIFVRKAVETTHPKLTVYLIDFDKPSDWADKVQGDVLFCCLGTTLKQAGSQQNQTKIDRTYPHTFAQIAKQNGIAHCVLVSSDRADAKSPLFYYRLKGELEHDLCAVGFKRLTIVRPPLLKRKNSDRLGERLGEKALTLFNRLGLLHSMRPMPTQILAKAMIQAVLQGKTGILDKQTLWALAR